MTAKWYRLKPTETHYAQKPGSGKGMFLYVGGEKLQLEDRNAMGIMDKLIPLDEEKSEFMQRQDDEEASGHSGEKKQDLELRREVANDGMYRVVHGETDEPIHEGVLTLEESNILMGGGELPEKEPIEEPTEPESPPEAPPPEEVLGQDDPADDLPEEKKSSKKKTSKP